MADAGAVHRRHPAGDWLSATSCWIRGRADPERLAELYLALATPKGAFVGAHRGIGRSFRQVLAELERGFRPDQSRPADGRHRRRDADRPGAAVTSADDPDAMFEAVLAASLMTHRDIRSLTGALAVAHALRRLIDGEPRDPSLLLWVAADVAKDEARIAAEHGEVVIKLDRARPLPCRAPSPTPNRSWNTPATGRSTPWSRRPTATAPSRRAGGRPMGFPPACIPTCLYLLLTTDSFEEAVDRGRSTSAAMPTPPAPSWAPWPGPIYGVDAIPRRWLDGLQNREGIEARAVALARRSAEGLDIPDLVATEHDLTRREGEVLGQFQSQVRGVRPVFEDRS